MSTPSTMSKTSAKGFDPMKQKTSLKTIWKWERYLKGKLVESWEDKNVVTDEGLTYLLSVGFKDGTKIANWYLLTFESDTTPNGAETYAAPVITECTAIDEATRPACTLGSISSNSVDNSASKATFTYNATKTIYGGAIVGGGSAATTKGDTAGGGKIYAVARFTDGAKQMTATGVLKVTVTLEAQDV
jgi:hypothetical protein